MIGGPNIHISKLGPSRLSCALVLSKFGGHLRVCVSTSSGLV